MRMVRSQEQAEMEMIELKQPECESREKCGQQGCCKANPIVSTEAERWAHLKEVERARTRFYTSPYESGSNR